MMSIVTTGPDTGYYADVFRSRKELAFAGADLYAYSYLYDNVNSKACISLRVHVNITRKRNALQRTFSSRRAFLLVRVRFFYYCFTLMMS